MRTKRPLITTVLLAALTTLATVLVPTQSVQAAERQPIVFVHGYMGSAGNWDTMVSRFKADGYASSELFAWQYNTGQSNVTTAKQLATYIDSVRQQTGSATVDVVTHSMGGLSSRYYLKNLGGQPKVDDWVSLGGPNHGTDSANWCFNTSCGEMRIGSSFLTSLNSGDETPGPVAYGTFWSSCDETINPDSSVTLSGATNKHVGCVGHLALLSDLGTYQGVRAFVA
ncbi:lipase, class 2 [Nocardioides sp. CF8]|uniref:esterase/lipase family protein n=1 Tax=Nocardioides sp. CF8 TaxID=110319 RepID=UPI00033035AB|nr:triacylglycerol lipase [Nocardioides sp. CF8]EON22838.1 lipase, class 2 [Nocardioides sp. CF8]